jgi:hypothetical protein
MMGRIEMRFPPSGIETGRHALLSVGAIAILAAPLAGMSAHAADDPLASWNEGATKQSIMDFVAHVTTMGGADHVVPEERIGTFDNGGTLRAEQPHLLPARLPKGWTVVDMNNDWRRIFPFE